MPRAAGSQCTPFILLIQRLLCTKDKMGLLPFVKRNAANISPKCPVPSPIIDRSSYSGFGLQDLCVSEFVLHYSYWTWLENMDYSLHILLYLPERKTRKQMKTKTDNFHPTSNYEAKMEY
jgi:hypothetical protein